MSETGGLTNSDHYSSTADTTETQMIIKAHNMADDHINYQPTNECRQFAIWASLYTNTHGIIRGSVEHKGCVPYGGSFKSRTSVAT